MIQIEKLKQGKEFANYKDDRPLNPSLLAFFLLLVLLLQVPGVGGQNPFHEPFSVQP
jgi:hypothetical protein